MSKHDDELCGGIGQLNKKIYYSSDRALVLEFHTDSSTQGNHKGFKGVFAFKDKSKFGYFFLCIILRLEQIYIY